MRKLLVVLLLMVGITMVSYAQEVHRYRLGDFEFIALVERQNAVDPSFVLNNNADRLAGLKFMDHWNSGGLGYFILRANGKTVLFDTGITPSSTLLMLSKAKIKPEEIDIICLTHMHKDHIGGMVETGDPVFKNARVYVSNEEVAYWEGQSNQLVDSVLRLYGPNMTRFKENAGIMPGVVAVSAFGHTPGHTAYKITSKGKTLIIWGDTVHVAAQFTDPDTYLTYDVNPKQAILSRKTLMEEIIGKGVYVVGMHMRMPAVGKIKASGIGYEFVPQPDGDL